MTNDDIPKMVLIPGGSFTMGSNKNSYDTPEEEPAHKVNVSSFLLGKYLVTQDQYLSVMQSNPAHFKINGGNRPVENVSWEEAKIFCLNLSEKTGQSFRLPSEAEWEYACRAGTTTPFYFGNTINTDQVNFDGYYPFFDSSINETLIHYGGERRLETTPVGSFPPNSFGLYDMHGNLWEWCDDVWHPNYKGAPIKGGPWLTKGITNKKVVRGGGWDSLGMECRSASRRYAPCTYKGLNVGIRVACSLDPLTSFLNPIAFQSLGF
jgi:formylglycine-generating enzyme required for sulfatase activity